MQRFSPVIRSHFCYVRGELIVKSALRNAIQSSLQKLPSLSTICRYTTTTTTPKEVIIRPITEWQLLWTCIQKIKHPTSQNQPGYHCNQTREQDYWTGKSGVRVGRLNKRGVCSHGVVNTISMASKRPLNPDEGFLTPSNKWVNISSTSISESKT